MHSSRLFWTIIFAGLLQMTIRVTGKEESEAAQGNVGPIGVDPVTKTAVDGIAEVIEQDEDYVGEQDEEDDDYDDGEKDNKVMERPTNESKEWGGLTQTDKELLKVLDQILDILKGSKIAELAEVKKAMRNIELYKEDILSVVGN